MHTSCTHHDNVAMVLITKAVDSCLVDISHDIPTSDVLDVVSGLFSTMNSFELRRSSNLFFDFELDPILSTSRRSVSGSPYVATEIGPRRRPDVRLTLNDSPRADVS